MVVDVAPLAERLGTVLLAASIAMAIARFLFRSAAVVAATGVLAIALLAVPIGPLPGLAYVFSVLGPLGAATLVLLTVAIVDALAPAATLPTGLRTTPLAATVLIAAAAFYPLVLGIGRFDPYSLGFSGLILPVGLGAILVLAVILRSAAMVIWLGLGLAMFLMNAYGSRNLLDYLIDPVSVPVAIAVLVRALVLRLRRGPAGQAAMSAKAATTSS
jgi:hypothetical protein